MNTSERESASDGHGLLQRLVYSPVRVGIGSGQYAVVGSLLHAGFVEGALRRRDHRNFSILEDDT